MQSQSCDSPVLYAEVILIWGSFEYVLLVVRQKKNFRMGSFRQIKEFNPPFESWIPFTEHLDQFFIANDIEDDKSPHNDFSDSCQPNYICFIM